MSLVKLVASQSSTKQLNEYLASLGFPQRKDFHTTVFYSEECPLFPTPEIEEKISGMLPAVLNPSTYRTEIFGENMLALSYEHEDVRKIIKILIDQGLNQLIHGYSDSKDEDEIPQERLPVLRMHMARTRTSEVYPLNPHITLGNFTGRLIKVPKFSIILDQIKFKPINC